MPSSHCPVIVFFGLFLAPQGAEAAAQFRECFGNRNERPASSPGAARLFVIGHDFRPQDAKRLARAGKTVVQQRRGNCEFAGECAEIGRDHAGCSPAAAQNAPCMEPDGNGCRLLNPVDMPCPTHLSPFPKLGRQPQRRASFLTRRSADPNMRAVPDAGVTAA